VPWPQCLASDVPAETVSFAIQGQTDVRLGSRELLNTRLIERDGGLLRNVAPQS
jgi:hypothetical protein